MKQKSAWLLQLRLSGGSFLCRRLHPAPHREARRSLPGDGDEDRGSHGYPGHHLDPANPTAGHASDSFATGGGDLLEFLVEHDMSVICGDRHWQYVSAHDETGLREYATGASSDSHAGSWIPGRRAPGTSRRECRRILVRDRGTPRWCAQAHAAG